MKLRPLTRWSALAAALAVVILIGFELEPLPSGDRQRWYSLGPG